MNTIMDTCRTTTSVGAVSRRMVFRRLGGAGVAALALGVPDWARASSDDRIAAALFGSTPSDDPAAVIATYVAAVNAGDLEGILALYDDDAVHIFLPTPDGSAGVCLGKDQFRLWYEQSVANGDRVEVEDGTLAVDGNQAAFVVHITSDPWTKLGLQALEANAEMVLIDGRIMTHVVDLTPESVRQLQAARSNVMDATTGSTANPLMTLSQTGDGWAPPPSQARPGQPY
jgi:ketosteroid isomerase-like protein